MFNCSCQTFVLVCIVICMVVQMVVTNYQVYQISTGISSLRTEMNSDMTSLRTDMTSLRTDMTSLRTDMTSLRTDMTSKIDDLGNFIKSRFDGKAYIDTARNYSVFITAKIRKADIGSYEGSGHIIRLHPTLKKTLNVRGDVWLVTCRHVLWNENVYEPSDAPYRIFDSFTIENGEEVKIVLLDTVVANLTKSNIIDLVLVEVDVSTLDWDYLLGVPMLSPQTANTYEFAELFGWSVKPSKDDSDDYDNPDNDNLHSIPLFGRIMESKKDCSGGECVTLYGAAITGPTHGYSGSVLFHRTGTKYGEITPQWLYCGSYHRKYIGSSVPSNKHNSPNMQANQKMKGVGDGMWEILRCAMERKTAINPIGLHMPKRFYGPVQNQNQTLSPEYFNWPINFTEIQLACGDSMQAWKVALFQYTEYQSHNAYDRVINIPEVIMSHSWNIFSLKALRSPNTAAGNME